ncbi:MAG: mechanosensitive ion channel family protein, partial [Puniceicoccales bacterium]
MEVLSEEVWGNAVWRYVAGAVCLIVGYIAGLIVKSILGAAATRKEKETGETPTSISYRALGKGMAAIGFAIAFRITAYLIEFPGRAEAIADTAAAVVIVGAFALLVFKLVEVPMFLLRKHAQKDDSRFDMMLVPLIARTIRVLIIAVAILQIFQIISGKDMTTILAGLGIASLAFGLAAQESIGNLFGSVFLFMNKPFEIGERCNIDGHDGVIKEMGLRSE